MNKTPSKLWPPIYEQSNRSGSTSYIVDLGMVDGKRKRPAFPTLDAAESFAALARVKRDNEGIQAFTLSREQSTDAARAINVLSPHNVTILEAAKYYERHVLSYKTAPVVKEIVEKYIERKVRKNLRKRSIGDLRSRYNPVIESFGERRLSEITLEELEGWIDNDNWGPVSKDGYLTKLSMLYIWAKDRGWVETNLTELIDRPKRDDKTPVEIYSVDEAEKLLVNAAKFDLLPYIAIGFFAGIRSAEMFRLTGRNINLETKTITVPAEAAKKRSQRIVDISENLLEWLTPSKDLFTTDNPLVNIGTYRWNKTQLMEAAEIKEWKYNGLRHSFGSYYYAFHRSEDDTAHQMGNSVSMVHKHYKALVSKAEAEKFWALRPKQP